jgi:hypothetical protein
MSRETKTTFYINANDLDSNTLEITYDSSNDSIYTVINDVNYHASITTDTIKQNPQFININYLVDFFIDNLEVCNLVEEHSGGYSIKWSSDEDGFTIAIDLIREFTELDRLREENAMLKKQLDMLKN